MAGFTIISDISQHIVALLRQNLCPSFITASEGISLISPIDKNADYQMGIYLYDLQEMGEYTLPQMVTIGQNKKQYPPKSLRLKYMIYLNQKSQIAAKGEDEQRILGLTMQCLYDNPTIAINKLHRLSDAFDEIASISILNMNLEEKSKIWTALALPMQLSIYLEVAPVLLASAREVTVTRVVETAFNTVEKSAPYE